MNLPTYLPGTIVYGLDDGEAVVFQIAECFVEHDEWHYQDDNGMQLHESEVLGSFNNGYYVPKDKWNPPQEANMPVDTSLYDKMTQPDPDEEEWLSKQKLGKEGRKIEVRFQSKDEAQHAKEK